MRRLRGGTHFDLVGRARTWFLISAVVFAVSIGSLVFGRGINAGLEFRGGTDLQVVSERPGVSVPDLRAALREAGVSEATIQE
ncbi:MAG: protein translocase subunit SecF, partial [Actinomycetota bacterium]